MAARDRGRSTRRIVAAIVASIGLGIVGWRLGSSPGGNAQEAMMTEPTRQEALREAIFAGGCFWCVEAAFELMPGVDEAISGYTGGHIDDPTYEQVSSGTTGHFEAVLVRYDPERIGYEQLLEQFWRSIDPTDAGGQFFDRGSQYHTAIFYLNEEQRALAEASKRALETSGVFDKPIVTQILAAQTFYPAEEYHQNYQEKYLTQYKAYSKASGREDYLGETWEGHEGVSLTGRMDDPEESSDE